MTSALQQFRYAWPATPLAQDPRWRVEQGRDAQWLVRQLPESFDELREDSRWPAFFPSPICLATTSDGTRVALEKVVGASIVNRFPYVMALSFCREPLSARHYVRRDFMDILEFDGHVAVQFLPPGPDLARVMASIGAVGPTIQDGRLTAGGLASARTNSAPVFDDAYLVYEGRLARPSRDFDGNDIYPKAWQDIGSHRVYFVEITAIQLRRDIALGESAIHWRSLPAWSPPGRDYAAAMTPGVLQEQKYQKGFAAHYSFPSSQTVAFEGDEIIGPRLLKYLPPLAHDQVEVDNDRARWPCFFPSSVGMITMHGPDGRPNLMPCGSTTILSRQPLTIAAAVSYAAINQRYAPRASLGMLGRTGRFGCGVPFISDEVLNGIRYAGNVSWANDPDKVRHAGFLLEDIASTPMLRELPIHYDCRVVGQMRLGTHVLFLGEVERIFVRNDVTPMNPLEWYPWSDVRENARNARCA